jgi:cytochrome b
MSESSGPSLTRVRVWDVPTRLVHWLIVLCIAIAWRTGTHGPMDWHRWSGYTLLGLLAFRVYWGFLGGSTARFSSFVRGPRAVLEYARGAWVGIGHNPLGALSVLALLVLIGVQVVLGLFTVDIDGIESGPLSDYVSFEAGRAAAKWHERVFDVLLWFAALHIVAVIVYLVRRQNLVNAMFTGRREFDVPPPEELRPAGKVRFILGVVIAVAITWAVIRAFKF